jgi:hypothetical protein
MSDTKLVTDVMLVLVAINFMLAIFAGLLLPTLPISAPAIGGFNNLQNTLSSNVNSISSNIQLATSPPNTNLGDQIFWALGLLWTFINILFGILLLILTAVNITIYMLAVLIPAILHSSLGDLSYIFDIVYTAVYVILGVYAAFELLKIFRGHTGVIR